MTSIDRMLQRWRIAKARRFLSPGMRVLDIGSADGELFQQVSGLAANSLGIDPTLKQSSQQERFCLLPGFFPKDMPPSAGLFDAVTMLAVLEHFPKSAYSELEAGCREFLKPGGLVIITVPAPVVDAILVVLRALRLIHGMALEEHHGYAISDTTRIFCAPHFELVCHRRFQLGLNHLFVFRRRQS